uniref:NADH-ubiquinone oxidoreductase chain 6 n=1 Tax=Bramus lutescens TaxID=3370998 RepID=A0A873A1C8_BRALU|nr:NADH dehydrogenase subunit 6 [Ellobius lutescens]
MMELIYFLSLVVTLGCLGASLKPSPIYGGLCLVISGCSGCLAVLGLGGSFLGLMVFLIYLGGMLVVFGYTTAMSAEEYPETWVSNWLTIVALVVGVFMELMLLYMVSYYEILELISEFNSLSGLVVSGGDELELMSESGVGVAALYSCSMWLMIVSVWALFMGVFIIIEIARGN